MIAPLSILQASKNILLVDWPNPGLPRTLLNAGFNVFGFSPNGYTQAGIVPVSPGNLDAGNFFPPVGEGESGYLLFRQLTGRPPAVDIVHVYRPEQELPGIFMNQVLPLAAKTLWLHPPAVSAEARSLAEGHGLNFVENFSIEEVARML
jgi:predicted CoA-binding protein